VICGLVLAVTIDPGPEGLATSNRVAADGPAVLTEIGNPAANTIDQGRIDTELVLGQLCPWDCAAPPNGNVGIEDFLAVLAEWGIVDTPCDFDGGGVGITDLLAILDNWGHCTQVNIYLGQVNFFNAVAKAGLHMKFQWNFNPHNLLQASEVAVPDPLDINTHDVGLIGPWYRKVCMDQPPNQATALPSDLDCDLCGGTQVVADQIVLSTAESLNSVTFRGIYFPGDAGGGDPLPDDFTVKIRENDNANLPGAVIRKILVGPASTRAETGLFVLGVREFEYTIDLGPTQELQPGTYWIEIYNNTNSDPTNDDWLWATGDLDPANGLRWSAFSGDPPNVPTKQWNVDPNNELSLIVTCGLVLWPPQVDNIRFMSNLTPGGPLTPGDDLAFATFGFRPDYPFDILRETTTSNGSIDVICGPPAGDNHRAIGLRIIGTSGSTPGSEAVLFHVTVYNEQDDEIGQVIFQTFNGTTRFVGIVTIGPEITIGRVDVWDFHGSSEAISLIVAYVEDLPAGDG